MLPETELLQYVYKTADMGVEGINAVLDYADNHELKKVLRDQKSEYVRYREKAGKMLEARDENLTGANPIAKVSSYAMATGKLMMDRSASKIAEMTIQGNSMGVSKTIKHLHQYPEHDEARKLTEELLATEKANIEQLKPFL
ncbi:MAG: hypothetical protein IKU61_03820 [Clostridia bacterium]|nr:hypothetical protein [Clostridia bacterium]